MSTDAIEVGGEVAAPEVVSLPIVQAITKAELDQQIATARAFPRSITRFQRECMEIVRLNESIAKECVYMVPRDGQTIEGPSSRLAEIVASSWGNCRASARVVDEGEEFITAQGVFHDLERNVAVSYEVRRRITTRNGRRYSSDMIATTGNAACSIAMRNAVFKGIPKAYWQPAFMHAKAVLAGDPNTVEKRRLAWKDFFQKRQVPEANVFAVLEVQGWADVGMDELAKLEGIQTAVKEGDTTIQQAFGVELKAEAKPAGKGVAGLKNALTAEPQTGASVLPGFLTAISKAFDRLNVPEEQRTGRLSNLLQRDVASDPHMTVEEAKAVVEMLMSGRTGEDGELERLAK